VIFQYKFSTVEEWEKNYSGPVNPEAESTILALHNQIQYPVFLLKNKIADPESIFSIVAPNWIILTWGKIRPIVRKWREIYTAPNVGDLTEYIYIEAKRKYPNVKILPVSERYPSVILKQES